MFPLNFNFAYYFWLGINFSLHVAHFIDFGYSEIVRLYSISGFKRMCPYFLMLLLWFCFYLHFFFDLEFVLVCEMRNGPKFNFLVYLPGSNIIYWNIPSFPHDLTSPLYLEGWWLGWEMLATCFSWGKIIAFWPGVVFVINIHTLL